jgi:hypothetical protein
VASSPNTNFDNVLTYRMHPELGIERGDPNNLFGRDICLLANVSQTLLRQIIKPVLHGLKDWNNRPGRSSLLRNDLIYNLLSFYFFIHLKDPQLFRTDAIQLIYPP